MNNEKIIINSRQFRAIVICLTWPTIINYGSGFLARETGRDMWLSGLISILTTMLFVYIVIHMGRNYPGKTIVEYSHDLLGSILGKMLGVMLALYFAVSAAISVSMYIQHLTDFLLPETPYLVVTIMHISVICYMIWRGSEVIGRIATIALFLTGIFYFLIVIAALPEFEISRLMPLFSSGVVAVSKASLSADSFIGMIQVVVAMMLPMVANQSKSFRPAATGLLIGGSLFVIYFIAEIMVMGPQLVAVMRIASMDLVRSIQITQYLHRFESFMVALWYWSILVQAGILASCSLKAFQQTVGIKKDKIYIILLFGLLLGIITHYIGQNRIFFQVFREHQWEYIALSFQYVLPVILLIVMTIKKQFTSSQQT
ncbi:MAG: GerAB/ArcD/ProY family transporter [Syntrophomonadaceae bacterium]|jgi:spore germination protein KB